MFVSTAFLSPLFELGIGYPDRLVHAIGHPVIWIGNLISFLDRKLNSAAASDNFRRFSGCIALVVLVGVPAGLAYGIQTALGAGLFGILITAILASSLIAQRSLASHVKAVAIPSASTKRASAAPPSKAWPRIFPTASLRRRSGWLSAGWRAASATRPPTPPIR
jgi:cobalamin biosynthesis protein CobD/CbiB